jgi:WD40 repeat protein
MAFSPKGDKLVTCGYKPDPGVDEPKDEDYPDYFMYSTKVVSIWDIIPHRTVPLIRIKEFHDVGSFGDIIISPNGSWLATRWEDQVDVISLRTGGRKMSADTGSRLPGTIQFLPDNRTLMMGNHDGSCKAWDIRTRKVLFDRPGPKSSIKDVYQKAIAISPDGSKLATQTRNYDIRKGVVIIWDTRTGMKIHVLEGPTGFFSRIVFSPDSQIVVAKTKPFEYWKTIFTIPPYIDFKGRKVLASQNDLVLWYLIHPTVEYRP